MCLGLPRRFAGGPHILLIFTHLPSIQRKSRLLPEGGFCRKEHCDALQLAVDDRAKVLHELLNRHCGFL